MGNATKTVFVVDDDEMIRQLGARIFQSRGHVIRTFASGRECLAAVSAQVPDCIVSDLQMPEMDGAQLIEELRARGLAVPVIIVTAAIGPSIQLDQARRAGAYRILSKPHSRREVLDAVDEALAGMDRAELGSPQSRDACANPARRSKPAS